MPFAAPKTNDLRRPQRRGLTGADPPASRPARAKYYNLSVLSQTSNHILHCDARKGLFLRGLNRGRLVNFEAKTDSTCVETPKQNHSRQISINHQHIN
jgi:hypothetical protein